jgi:hypothetical protein
MLKLLFSIDFARHSAFRSAGRFAFLLDVPHIRLVRPSQVAFFLRRSKLTAAQAVEMQGVLDQVVLMDVLIGGSTGEKTVDSDDFIREVGKMLPTGTFSWVSKYRSAARREMLNVGTARRVDNRSRGYFIPVAKAAEVAQRLLQLRDDFYAEKAKFLLTLPLLIEEWAQHKDNTVPTKSGQLRSDLIRLHAPKPSDLDQLLKFALSAVRVVPAEYFGADDALRSEVTGMAGQAAQEIAEDVRLSWKGPVGGRTSSRVLGLVRRIREKADSMSIISSKFGELKVMCDNVLSSVPSQGTIEGTAFVMVSGLLAFCQKPANILGEAHSADGDDGVQPSDASSINEEQLPLGLCEDSDELPVAVLPPEAPVPVGDPSVALEF